MLKQSLIGIFAASLILTGCGDSGDSSSGPTYTGPTEAVSVTDTSSANNVAKYAASAATSALMTDLTTGYITPLATTSSLSVTGTNTRPLALEPRSLGILTKRFADMAFSSDISAIARPAGVTDSATYNCATSGSVNLYASVSSTATPFELPGDLFKITFNNCVEGGVLTTGSIQFVINSYLGTNNFSATYTFSNFKETYAGDYFMVHGSYTAAVTNNTIDLTYSITGDSLLFEGLFTSIGPDVEQLRYTNFSFVDKIYSFGAPTSYGFDHDFTISSTEIGGTITVDTVNEFVIAVGDMYPTSGEIVITCANNAKVHLWAVDNTQVSYEYDLDGDGSYESGVTTVAWSSL